MLALALKLATLRLFPRLGVLGPLKAKSSGAEGFFRGRLEYPCWISELF